MWGGIKYTGIEVHIVLPFFGMYTAFGVYLGMDGEVGNGNWEMGMLWAWFASMIVGHTYWWRYSLYIGLNMDTSSISFALGRRQ
ncbi:hypothetical protein VTL71DRAFT_10215 [Oculimacula yallundae]|uniref:Uncharacterized protein n=1 Tax=Oculimacula yallundae TaxID=86028 RepID=A0ABR4BSS4_9HELO